MTNRAAAMRYARALFDVALKEADVVTVQTALQAFADLVRSHATLAHALSNPAISIAQKRAVVKALLDRAESVPAPVSKVILLLADRDRLVLLGDIAAAYNERVLDHQKVMRGRVTTAVPLEAAKVQALEQGFARATGRTVMLDSAVDPSIIGGVVTRLGSTVYDGSVVTQLQKMKQALVEGSERAEGQ
jgi:F-type H+-transporting ATPase subunit delta